jgi:hypothetical protein
LSFGLRPKYDQPPDIGITQRSSVQTRRYEPAPTTPVFKERFSCTFERSRPPRRTGPQLKLNEPQGQDEWSALGAKDSLGVIVGQALLIAGLLLQHRRRRHAEAALQDRLSFETLVADLSAAFVNLRSAE